MYHILNIVDMWRTEANCQQHAVLVRLEKNKLYIYTNRPGAMIGQAGCFFDKYVTQLRNKTEVKSVKIVECFDSTYAGVLW